MASFGAVALSLSSASVMSKREDTVVSMYYGIAATVSIYH
jgi:hypothetical protein